MYVPPSGTLAHSGNETPWHFPPLQVGHELSLDKQSSPKMFVEDLKACNNLESLRVLRGRTKFWLEAYSREAFQRLLHNEPSIEDILSFIDEPSLNEPQAKNFQHFVQWMVDRSSLRLLNDPLQLKMIAPWFQLQLRLGRLSEDDVQAAISLLSHFSSNEATVHRGCQLADAIVEGLAECPVLKFSNLRHPTIHELLRSLNRIVSACNSESSAGLMFRLLEHLDQSRIRSSLSEIGHFLLLRMHMIMSQSTENGSSHSDRLRAIDNDFSRVICAVPETLKIQRIKPEKSRGLFICLMTRKLLTGQLKLRPDDWSQMCDQWFCLLARNGLFVHLRDPDHNANISGMLSVQSSPIIASFARHLDERALCHFTLSSWCDAPSSALDLFAKHITSFATSPLSLTLLIAQATNSRDNPFVTKIFGLLRALHRFKDITRIIEAARRMQLQLPASTLVEAVRASLLTSSRHARVIFMSDPRLLLECCPELAEQFILNHSHPENVWHLHRNRSGACRRAAFNNNMSEWRKARADLLARMAKAFSAVATELTHDKFYWHVHGCWKVHIREQLGPPGPVLSRSLLWTGVILPLRDHRIVNETRIRRILDAVREAEGDDVADSVGRDIYAWRGNLMEYLHWRKRRNFQLSTKRSSLAEGISDI